MIKVNKTTITAIKLLILRSFQKKGCAIVAYRLKALPLHTIISNNTFKVTICDLKNKDRNMADITEKTGNGELVTNRDQLVGVDNIEPLIKIIRGQQVMLDKDLATLYGVETRTLNQAVKRNIQRFPSDFRFQLTMEECSKSQIEEYHSLREI